MRFWARVGAASVLLVTGALLAPVGQQVAGAEDPVSVNWTSLLPGLTDTYNPSSENVCVAGKPRCIDAVIKEMKRRFEPLGRSCHHNAIFSLAYLRTTQTYKWASDQPGYFNDTPWVNHEAAVFAKYYFAAYDNWAAGLRGQAPQAWLIAFDAAAGRRVSGSGDLMLGMSAHINRDLPLALAAAHRGRGSFRPRRRPHRHALRRRIHRTVPAGAGMARTGLALRRAPHRGADRAGPRAGRPGDRDQLRGRGPVHRRHLQLPAPGHHDRRPRRLLRHQQRQRTPDGLRLRHAVRVLTLDSTD